MPELPWVKWFPTNWASEPGLRLCEAATRGIWFEALNTMFLQKSGTITGTIEELASLLLCRTSQMQLAVSQLKTFKVADVSEQNGNISLTCRRTVRQYEIKELRRNAGIISGNKRGTKRQHASASASSSDSGESVRGVELLSENAAISQCEGVLGIPKDFAKYAYQDWESRDGRDAASVQVSWPRYVKKRWSRESVQWQDGSHKGKSQGKGTSALSDDELLRNST